RENEAKQEGIADADLAQEAAERSQLQQAFDGGSARGAGRCRAGGDGAALRRRAGVLENMPAQEMQAPPPLRRRSDGVPAPPYADRRRAQSRSGALLGGARRPHAHPAGQSRRICDAAHAGLAVVSVREAIKRENAHLPLGTGLSHLIFPPLKGEGRRAKRVGEGSRLNLKWRGVDTPPGASSRPPPPFRGRKNIHGRKYDCSSWRR